MPETDPENYSLDEMMRRLQARGRQDLEGQPELVTRADGTQALRVRKRKRRSHQPHKEAEKRRRRRVLIGVTLAILVVTTGSLGLLGWFFYLNGDAYQNRLAQRIEAWTGGKLSWQAFRATPVNAAADRVELRWPETSPVSRVQLTQLRTDLGLLSHVTGVWKGEQLKGAQGRLDLRVVDEIAGFNPPAGPVPFRMPLRANQFNVHFGERFAIYHATATLRIADPAEPAPNLILQEGACRVPRWGRYTVNYASVGWSSQGVRIGTLQVSPQGEPTAEFEISGEGFAPVDPRGGVAELGLKVREMPSFALLGNGLGTLVAGTFESPAEDSDGRIRIDPTALDSMEIEVPVSCASGSTLKFDRLPMFETLGSSFDSLRLIQPRYDAESTLRVVRQYRRISAEELNLISDGLVWIRGELTEGPGGRLDGTLQVGVAKSLMVLADSPAVETVFGEAREDYHWATVQVGGTTKEPTDDLARRLAAAAESISPTRGGVQSLEDEFRELTTPSGE